MASLQVGMLVLRRARDARHCGRRAAGGEVDVGPNSCRSAGCPVAAFQKMIGGKDKLRILRDLKDGPRRYGEIRSGLLQGAAGTQEIAPRVLNRELQALTESGLLARQDYGTVPPKVEYKLTGKGANFIPVVGTIRDWGERNLV